MDSISSVGESNQSKGNGFEVEIAIEEYPDGGLLAWSQVVGSFVLVFCTWGLTNSFGAYQTYYESGELFTQTSSNISWIGSIQAYLLMLVGIITGPLFDRGYFKALLIIGSFMIVFGIMMSSLSTTYYQVMLSQGICMGVGMGALWVPSLGVCVQYFLKYRSIAITLAASGGSIGGVIFPIIIKRLIPKIGFGWTCRVIGLICFVTLFVPIMIMKQRTIPETHRKILQLSSFKELPYLFLTIGLFLSFTGIYIPFYYISSYANRIAHTSINISYYMISIINASLSGRIIPNYYADRVGPINTMIVASFISGVLALVWIGIRNTPGLIIFSVLYGISSGTVVSLPPSAISSVTNDITRIGSRLGTAFFFAGFGTLIGNPVAGKLIDINKGEFYKGQIWSGVMTLGSTFFLTLAQYYKRKAVRQVQFDHSSNIEKN
ncbi:similar to Saccharomyces cerevisiae YOR306C MCH5 Plasma membrane riboflavin transporter [Maudiozyma saulgeensis]|uniref:Similar to Saccharomyces cerevisiae YOR306C MCH5 Plasma membrane riboflavin transporter n=1 Tax=Maudiozyma saulgeensis TaxID=1789683 RepID=A0A1X7R080_9SACH|nr:similar to Saccharomyces cerevisiae YOR306C MCH5 Plasma membrane riboflavin transporter [Kazachstania saulgeensis]